VQINTDICIIGSGFSGAIIASRLVDAGYSVTVLERGPWRKTRPVTSSGITQSTPFPRGIKILTRLLRTLHHPKLPFKSLTLSKKGLYEYGVYKGVNTVCSSGVGGGSHVYGALLERSPNKEYWNGITDTLNEELMDAHYERVESELLARSPTSVSDIPNYTPEKWKNSHIFNVSDDISQPSMGLLFPGTSPSDEQFERHVSRYKGDSVFGSPSGAKGTVDFLYLIPALKKGLKLLDMHEVNNLQKLTSGGYKVDAINHRTNKSLSVNCQKVILTAGTMNTVKLLFQSRSTGGLQGMPMLGEGFGSNGDYSALWELQDTKSDFTKGTPCHGRVAIPGAPKEPDYVLGGVDMPPIPSWVPRFIRHSIDRQKHNVLLIGMGADAADGKFSFQNNKLNLKYDQKNSPIFEQIRQGFKQVGKLSGKPVRYGYKAVTVHPFGGAKIGRDDSDGVVGSNGEVFGNPSLFIADGSVLPKAVGGPPSLTIGAWSSHVADQIIKTYSPSKKTEKLMTEYNLVSEKLVAKSFKELDAIFAALPSPVSLDVDGHYWGKLLVTRGLTLFPFFIRRPLVWAFEKILFLNWKGKSFSGEKGINLFKSYEKPKKALPFKVGLSISRDGSGQVVQLDYNIEKNPKKFRKILGEARQLNESEWLAKMYYGDKNWLYYILKK
jgi:cholesterol oxidase